MANVADDGSWTDEKGRYHTGPDPQVQRDYLVNWGDHQRRSQELYLEIGKGPASWFHPDNKGNCATRAVLWAQPGPISGQCVSSMMPF